MTNTKNQKNTQIKSRARVKSLAEVFTAEREVNAMLDLVSEMFPSGTHDLHLIDKRFLEPAVGTGNFVVEILRRKLQHVPCFGPGDVAWFQAMVLKAVGSIYAVDIDTENVAETRARLLELAVEMTETKAGSYAPGCADELRGALTAVLTDNIVLGNTLTDMGHLLWASYDIKPGALGWTVQRRWSVAGSDTVAEEETRPQHLQSLKPRADSERVVNQAPTNS